MSDNIKVVVKVRPLIPREIEEKLSYQWRVKNNTLYQIDQQGRDLGQAFTFDQVYDQDTKTSDVYNDVAKPIVEAATAGFNGTIFAYGQTSSGKTYTMTGTEDSPGIIPLAIINLFDIIKNIPDRDFLVRVSYMEIYNEKLKDLLDVKKDNMKIHESLQGIKVDTTEKMTSSPEEVLDIMKQGEANRQTGSTNMNEMSSRSHSIFQITIESREHVDGSEQAGCVNVAQLNLVDLAGSERAGQTGATGIRFKEGTHINKSLSSLALVIKQLSEGPNKHANYRDSKLTRLLQNSLGGNAKTSIICAVTPAAVEETISTLQFANRAKAIKNKPEVNAVATDATMILRLTKQLSELQMQLETKKNLELMLETKKNIERDNYNLQKQIAALQRFLHGFVDRNEDRTAVRKPPPRRVTISTLHSIEVEPPPPQKQKFCTPLLKYNPMLLPGASDFVPVQTLNKLPTLPEESGLVTPPPTKRAFGSSDEVIDLDSDDDLKDACSPYHKCFSHSITPPCILRKNAKQAERDLKDIMELTEREKMYKPNVVELMDTIEQHWNTITKLQDEVGTLQQQCNDKDSQLLELKNRITLSEHEVKQVTLEKAELEKQCKEFNTKLTDWEVMYETLKNKAKLREEELLSLLDEKKVFTGKRKNADNDLTHFMDMSKDISLVNSDNESSISNTHEDPPLIQDIVTDLQAQLTMKTQVILELEANLFAHQQKIASIENTTLELNDMVSNLKEKLQLYENENSLLKATTDNLNSTIKAQKSSLELANNDIESYNNLIQELQIKLTQKESLINIDINESLIETMITNEDQFIANNENMKNIIHTFKVALDKRNKEIAELKSNIESKTTCLLDGSSLNDKLEANDKLIQTLNDEVDNLKQKLHENVATIDTLTKDKSNLEGIECELRTKLAEIELSNKQLEEMNKEKETLLHNIKENNDQLVSSIANINEKERELISLNENLNKQIQDSINTIDNLEKEISDKEKTINMLSQKEDETQTYVLKAKSSINKLQAVLNILSGDIQECPNVIENIVNMLNMLCDRLNILETIATNVVADKDSAVKQNAILKDELAKLTDKYNVDIKYLEVQRNHLSKIENNELEKESLLKQITDLTSALENIQSDLSIKSKDLDSMSQELTQIRESNESLVKEIVAKDNVIASLKDDECQKRSEIAQILEKYVQMKNEVQNLQINMKSKEDLFNEALEEKEIKITDLTTSLSEIDTKVKEKLIQLQTAYDKVNSVLTERDEHMKNILLAVVQITQDCSIENSLSCEFENVNINIYEQIRLTLEKIVNHIIHLKSRNFDSNIETILDEAKEEIKHLTKHNLELMTAYTKLENRNEELLLLIEQIQTDNTNLKQNIVQSNDVVKQLKQELYEKMENIEMEASHIEEIKFENSRLKERCLELLSQHHFKNGDVEQFDSVRRSLSNSIQNIELNSPPSLLTICCNKIVDYIEPSDSKSESSFSIEQQNVDSQTDSCKCAQLSLELAKSKEENSELLHILDEMQLAHQQLLQEQEEVRREVNMLLEPATELQKKIANHKTNLSILTATTYTENKSLQSQVTALQHHHNRFHNVCQRDIPEFKNKLRELMLILNSDPSLASAHNASFKRYSLPDVLDNNSTISNFKNESTLDGDLLMLDTNVTLMSTDNTLIGHDQTCLDLQVMYNDVSCQTNELQAECKEFYSSQTTDVMEELKALKEDNSNLQEQIKKYTAISLFKSDAANSPIKFINNYNENKDSVCVVCNKQQNDFRSLHDNLVRELDLLSKELSDVKSLKEHMEEKYKNLLLEIPSTDALVKKLTTLEAEYNIKVQENTKLTNTLNNKMKELKQLQDENDTLSTQVMENISEADDLHKELEKLKDTNNELTGKCERLEQLVTAQKEARSIDTRTWSCSQCSMKDNLMHSLPASVPSINDSHTKLNRSYSDSDTSSRHNKINTLQSELTAGREDCKELTEEVATIKNHLERSNLSMDLDESMCDASIYGIKSSMPKIPEEPSDSYNADKNECLNYYVEIANADRSNLNCDIKIVDIMKMLYENLITKHGNEVENLVNKLKDFEESKAQLQAQIDTMTLDYQNAKKELRNNINSITNVVSEIKSNTKVLTDDIANNPDADQTPMLLSVFKENVLKILDFEFGLSSVDIFDYLIDNITNKRQKDLGEIMVRYSQLQKHMEGLTTELTSANEKLDNMKLQLSDKEKEFNLMKAQKERVHEISNAVTLDIVRREEDLNKLIVEGCKKLLQLNIVNITDIHLNSQLNTNINLLFEHLINQIPGLSENSKEKDNLIDELNNLKAAVSEKDNVIDEAKTRNERLHEINATVTLDLIEKDKKLNNLNTLYEDLQKIFNSKVEENEANLKLTENLTEEIAILKEIKARNDVTLHELRKELDAKHKRDPEKDLQIADLTETIIRLREEIVHMRTVNDMISKEKQEYASELEKSGATIKANASELDKMTSDILILRESVRENALVVDNLKQEASSLLKQNMDLKHQFELKCQDCSRLEVNIKTHEKTAEIQSRMIIRLQKQKEEDDKTIKEKEQLIQQFSEKCTSLQREYDTLQASVKTHMEDIDALTASKQSLEVRISELLSDMEIAQKPRLSLEAKTDSSRRRRQSLYDSKRFFDEEFQDQNNLEAVFETRSKPDDLFMDVDDDMSNRSTPIRLSRGRDSTMSRTNQSDKEEDQPSRPSSVLAARKRRQSAHDLHRSIIRHTPSPHENSGRLIEEPSHLKSESSSSQSGDSSEVYLLKKQLSTCQIELEEMRERYRELDDECETCAQYLRERDQQCSRLKKEKMALENTVKELQDKMQLVNTDLSQNGDSRRSVAHVSVNTDEDWANLHAVVVDRMSYDAEVEKNKRLTKTIDELRFKKQELKNTLAKMQKALDKCSGKDNRELEATKEELESCREELSNLRQRYKELDEECETCAEYLRERDQQCRRLKEAKAALENKLQELQEDNSLKEVVQSARKKRQSTHDQNRSTSIDLVDATTETSDDFLSYQVEKDSSKQIAEDTHEKEIKRLRMTIEKLSHQRASLEQQLATTAAAVPLYVATGSAIVQNQQLTDVMKENQKLKKINAKLINICKKRGKGESNRENMEPSEQG